MDTANLIALYGAGLSTLLASSQGISVWRHRTRVKVTASIIYSTPDSYGTPVSIQRGEDTQDETVSICFTIRNMGGKPVQVLGLMTENLNKSTLQVSQITGHGLPIVLEPETTIEVYLQKEHLDLLESCTFIGAVDGTGRRHPVPRRQAKAIIEESWRLPTRVAVCQRRDDASKRVVAYQLAEPGKFTERRVDHRRYRKPRIITKRPRPLMESLMTNSLPHQLGAPSNE